MKNAPKILIVDDDKSSSQLFSEVVKRLGFKPIVANKPTDALNTVKLQSVHGAIVDVLLPKMSGVDLVSEFRKTRFADNPVILVSGVFKDKSFAQDAMKKCKAKEFLFKPFGAEELTESIKRAMAGILSAEKWTPQTLLTRKLTSVRDRAKAIEHLEEMTGPDLPFVLGILMEAKVSGHLNIVNEVGEIYGVSVVRGALAEVDSAEAKAAVVLVLISRGFLAQEDWEQFAKTEGRKYTLERLVSEGMVSPHALNMSKHEQILADIKSICSAQKLQVNFIPNEDTDAPPNYAVNMKQLLHLLAQTMNEIFPMEYLREFYSPVLNAPLLAVRSKEDMEPLWKTKGFSQLTSLQSAIESGGVLSDVLAQNPELQPEIFHGLHYLVLSRWVIFDDVNRAKSLNAMMERYRQLAHDLEDKLADEIFAYFGGGERLAGNTIEKIYSEYIKSNSPDQLPKEAPPELVAICQSCFDKVTEARDIMLDDTKRAALFESKKNVDIQRQRKAKELTTQGLDQLRKGQFQLALKTLNEAATLHSSSTQYCIKVWAEVKVNAANLRSRLPDLARGIDAIPAEDKKSAYYFMALGMIKKAQGDPTYTAAFEKVLDLDSTFVEARRELAATATRDKDKKVDIFHGDITEVVSQLFRRKVD